MTMVGHATESIYRRCAIQDEAMLREASEQLDVSAAQRTQQTKAERRGRLQRFKRQSA